MVLEQLGQQPFNTLQQLDQPFLGSPSSLLYAVHTIRSDRNQVLDLVQTDIAAFDQVFQVAVQGDALETCVLAQGFFAYHTPVQSLFEVGAIEPAQQRGPQIFVRQLRIVHHCSCGPVSAGTGSKRTIILAP